jgi:DNA-directed RNA polymerase
VSVFALNSLITKTVRSTRRIKNLSSVALLSYNETSTTTVCPTLIDKQVEQERLQIHIGKNNLKQNTLKAENKAYASSTIYGITSIQELIPHVEEAIAGIKTRIHKGKNGAAFKEIKMYLDDIEPLVAAGIACKIVFDKVFSFKDADDNLLVNVADSVGTAVMQECQMRYYERMAPGLLHALKENYWHAACGTQQKLTDVALMMKRADIVWTKWARPIRVKLGNLLIDTVVSTSGWFEDHVARNGKTTRTYLVPTPLFMDLKDKILAQAELFSAEQWPMLIPPRPWTATNDGGYILDEVMHGHDMVRRGNPGRIQGEMPIEFLNKVQSVAYQLNPFMVHVAETLYAKGWVVGIKDPKFIPHTASEPLPTKPVDIDTNEVSRKQYCREAAEVHNRNHALVRKSCRTRMTMKAVERFKDVDRFYLPWSFDYRGRAYPIPAFLTPQDTDFGKSLLRFADGSFVTPEAEDWLAFQVATTFGLDKAPMSERLAWTKDNHDLITLIAEDPIDNLCHWENVSEPWQFLAACEEYNACVIQCTRQFTSLMVATDATCSGLQILAGLARDKSTAKLVNVMPGDCPQDAYKAVAELARPNCPEQWREHIDRGVAKRLVMTIPYNAKFKSNWNYVKIALTDKDKGKGLDVPTEDITAITHALREAVFALFPGPKQVMEWIELEVANAIGRGATELTWTTPSGFVVSQKIMKPEMVRMDLQLLGKVKMVTVAVGDSDEVDINKHKAATSPNLIHSLDASLLHIATLRFNAPIALIHDSVLCRATDMSVLSTIVRETYMHLFADHDYLKDFAQQIGAESDPPIIGDLEPETVIDSTYFFC